MPTWMAVTNILDAGAIQLRYKYKVDAATTDSYESDLAGEANIAVNGNLKVITQTFKGVDATNLVEICVIDKSNHCIGNVITNQTYIQEVDSSQ
jgi:hypothetical protein